MSDFIGDKLADTIAMMRTNGAQFPFVVERGATPDQIVVRELKHVLEDERDRCMNILLSMAQNRMAEAGRAEGRNATHHATIAQGLTEAACRIGRMK